MLLHSTLYLNWSLFVAKYPPHFVFYFLAYSLCFGSTIIGFPICPLNIGLLHEIVVHIPCGGVKRIRREFLIKPL